MKADPTLVIYADPPWRYSAGTTKRSAIEVHYPTMLLEDVRAIRVPSDPHSVLFLWATNPLLLEALSVMDAWGFKYKTNMAWDKQFVGLGYWLRSQHELLLIGTRGAPATPDPSLRIPSVWAERAREHSRKPDGIRNRIACWYPRARKIELFARPPLHPEWESFGNESAKLLEELL